MQTLSQFLDDLKKYNLETTLSGVELQRYFIECNGCGAKGGLNVPDTMYGLCISSACNIHDMEWHLSRSYFDLVEANQRFRRNVERIIDKGSANRFMVFLRMRRLHKYYDAVKLIGTPSYAEDKGFEKV